MDSRVVPFAGLLKMNARLVRNCVAGFDDLQAVTRIFPSANHASFLVAHVTDARFSLLRLLGAPGDNPLAELLATGTTLDEIGTLPPLDHLLEVLSAVDARLGSHLEEVSAGVLNATSPTRFPISDPTVLGGLAFLCQHDSYHVGQLGMIRRALGFPAMRY